MQTPPTAIRIISSWLIFSGVVALIINVTGRSNPAVIEIMSRNPLPLPVQLAWVYLGAFVSLLCGIALMKGRSWARFLYLFWTGTTLVASFVTSPVKMASVPGLLFFIIVAFFLFHPKTEAYFTGQEQRVMN